MADNLCGPSAPTKGLVAHIDRNNNIQQDRLVNASPAGGSNSFRSLNPTQQLQAQLAQASVDADFAKFTTASPGGNLPTQRFMDRQVSLTPAYQRPTPSLPVPNLSWAQDFQRMQRASGQQQQSLADLAPTRTLRPGDEPSMPALEPGSRVDPWIHVRGTANGPNHMITSSDMRHHLEVASYMDFAKTGPRSLFQPPEPATEKHTHYPQDATLADSTEEAMEAAFAAYDENFQAEADQWMAVHGDAELNKHDDALVEIAYQEEKAKASGVPTFLPQNDQATKDIYNNMEQDALRKAAAEVLKKLGEKNQDKYKNSSFFELMGRMSLGQVVVKGNDLVDMATGQVIDNSKDEFITPTEQRIPAKLGKRPGATVNGRRPLMSVPRKQEKADHDKMTAELGSLDLGGQGETLDQTAAEPQQPDVKGKGKAVHFGPINA